MFVAAQQWIGITSVMREGVGGRGFGVRGSARCVLTGSRLSGRREDDHLVGVGRFDNGLVGYDELDDWGQACGLADDHQGRAAYRHALLVHRVIRAERRSPGDTAD